ncbi:uncharacterized protein M421DRAFT_131625 [Didymella exigua CBS 183.55]|uniref:Uncharacterized protein n=1 Tax=Didymella exigua CBS 183.55 TaxID=1150837 RepID=A0A6A5RU89_9PLEO|nr:uncharacterized protein M421DRAFT_131625 [Didymella exigua CBS 183.55]KAF1929876.1 hypothetical protein M421DRAFT_131625 [Didymella exigua CBS 183.55]
MRAGDAQKQFSPGNYDTSPHIRSVPRHGRVGYCRAEQTRRHGHCGQRMRVEFQVVKEKCAAAVRCSRTVCAPRRAASGRCEAQDECCRRAVACAPMPARLRHDTARRATHRASVREGKVRYVHPCAARLTSTARPCGRPNCPILLLVARGCAVTAPVGAGARLTRPKVCLASGWNHLAGVDPAHGMLHK